MKKKWKRKTKIILSVFYIILGLCMLAYPWISNYLYENRADSIINTYEAEVEELDDTEKNKILQEARKYNEQLFQAKIVLTDPFNPELQVGSGQFLNYNSVLSIGGTGLMGSIEIPKISVYLPIYHGTSADVLERGVGHLENTSLPVGGENTHAVLSAHTGLNTAKLFTDLVDLKEEDLFFIHVLGDVLAYQVCDIQVVEPDNVDGLSIQKGRDLVTLVTCTPYGVNSHRLLVTGERTEYTPEKYQNAVDERGNAPESIWMRTYKRAVMIGLAIVALIGLVIYLLKRKKDMKAIKKM